MKHTIASLQRCTLIILLLLGAGCRPDLDREHSGAAGDGGVGAACSSDEDCIAELICVKELPGGNCTRICSEEDGYYCPEPTKSLCVTINLAGERALACASLCADSYHPEYPKECRDGYRCVSVGTTSVCGM